MKVQYTKDKKTALYNGEKFTRDEETGYYLSTRDIGGKRKRLHCYVWETENKAEIPTGADIHHKDGDKTNNDAQNLEAISRKEHRVKHDEMDPSIVDFRRRNVVQKAMPAAKKWHSSEEGKNWHKEHGEKAYAGRKENSYVCMLCGNKFTTKHVYPDGVKTFCSNKCKATHRRRDGVDNETRFCAICGDEFIANKYSKVKYCEKHKRGRGFK